MWSLVYLMLQYTTKLTQQGLPDPSILVNLIENQFSVIKYLCDLFILRQHLNMNIFFGRL